MRLEEIKRRVLGQPPGLLDKDAQLPVIRQYLGRRQQVQARRQDRGLDHRVLRPVEPEEVALAALGHHFGRDRRPLVEKTGGPAEREAFSLLERVIAAPVPQEVSR